MEEFCRLKARELIQEVNVTAPPVDVEKIARACGLEVEYVDRGHGFSGQLFKERRIIEVQRGTHPHHQRFTIAHEVGHHVLGHNTTFCVFDEKSIDNPTFVNEKQASIFASELLMPDSWVKKHWPEVKKDFKAMAKLFLVSETAMFIRLEEANLLDFKHPRRSW